MLTKIKNAYVSPKNGETGESNIANIFLRKYITHEHSCNSILYIQINVWDNISPFPQYSRQRDHYISIHDNILIILIIYNIIIIIIIMV